MPFKGDPRAGVVYTRPYIVELALDMAEYTSDRDLTGVRLLDIGCGYGQFIAEATRRLVDACVRRGLTSREALEVLEANLRGVEIDPRTATHASNVVRSTYEAAYGPLSREFSAPVVLEGDYLAEPDSSQFDIIVGNLPYVKYETIPKLAKAQSIEWIASHFPCFDGRADYSVAFLQKALGQLRGDGRTAIVTSNRFTQAEYGLKLRRFLAERQFKVDEVDLSFIRAFDENVTAYASLFLIERADVATSKYVRLRSADAVGLAHLRATGIRNARSTDWYHVAARGALPKSGAPWSPLPSPVMSVLRRLQKKFGTVQGAGFAVKKGPATGADAVFIGPAEQFPLDEQSRSRHLLRLWDWTSATRPDGAAEKYLLCPYETGTRRLLALDELPSDIVAYLEKHRVALEKRHIVKEQEREWWSTIDPIDPGVLAKEKVMVPDLKLGSAVRRDRGQYAPGHTIVYATSSRGSLPTFEVLLKSQLADLYRLWLSPGLRSNTPRASPKVIADLPYPHSALPRGADVADLYETFGLSNAEVSKITRAHASMASS